VKPDREHRFGMRNDRGPTASWIESVLMNFEPKIDFYVGWGSLALINAGLAQSKGRSGLVWWLLSLLLGPIATFLIVILEKVPQERYVIHDD
jgi:hypothetical protein